MGNAVPAVKAAADMVIGTNDEDGIADWLEEQRFFASWQANELNDQQFMEGFDMEEFTISEMKDMQRQLQEKYKDKWEGVSPEVGKNQLLWMIGEIGEVIDIIKKQGSNAIMEDPAVRTHFVEEMADVLMFYSDILLCFDIPEEDLKRAYTEKFQRNLNRW